MTNIFIDRHKNLSDFIVHPPPFITKYLNNYTWRIKTVEKKLYLTFDDGPIPFLTEKILDILNEFQAKATFFCVGDNVRKYPDIYQKILDAGHTTGNHTFSHLNGWKTPVNEYLDDTKKAEKYIDSHLFRPPHGKIKTAQQEVIRKKYDIILWDILTLDYDQSITKQQCFRNIKHFARPGSVIVFHDNYKAERNMLYSLRKTLEYYGSLGYSFEKITTESLHKKNNRVKVLKSKPLSSNLALTS